MNSIGFQDRIPRNDRRCSDLFFHAEITSSLNLFSSSFFLARRRKKNDDERATHHYTIVKRVSITNVSSKSRFPFAKKLTLTVRGSVYDRRDIMKSLNYLGMG